MWAGDLGEVKYGFFRVISSYARVPHTPWNPAGPFRAVRQQPPVPFYAVPFPVKNWPPTWAGADPPKLVQLSLAFTIFVCLSVAHFLHYL